MMQGSDCFSAENLPKNSDIMPISPSAYKDALRHFPAGVTIVTIKAGDEIHGLTVSAFASISPSPPLIMVAIDQRNHGHKMMERSNAVFAVNILHNEQEHLSNRFAWQEEDRFGAGDWGSALTGAPILKDAIAWLDCTIYSRHNTGTHTIYIGEVQASEVVRPDEKPLAYWNRNYHNVADRPQDKSD